MRIDKDYCMSHYLALRYIADPEVNFFDGLTHRVHKPSHGTVDEVSSWADVDASIKRQLDAFVRPNRTAVLLSGGMDSAVLASYLPSGTKAYTFHCVADGAINEVEQATRYAKRNGLDHEVIDMSWRDFEELTPELLASDGVPFHSIEVQLLKASRLAKAQGFDHIVFGDAADTTFGGMDRLLSRDWTFDAFMRRYNYVDPAQVLRSPVSVVAVYEPYRMDDGRVDVVRFLDEIYAVESEGSYINAFELAGVRYLDPYAQMRVAGGIDLARIRTGQSKYLVRELFARRYPDLAVPEKIPMPRAMTQWLSSWSGPRRHEFIRGCEQGLSGDQKWLCWCLEQYLNKYDPER